MGAVIIYATGGTIAGSGASASQTAGYSSGTISITDIIKQNPHLSKIANLRGKQICNLGSPDITSQTLLKISQEIQDDLAKPDVTGIVITHGTDTMEETAFFLDVTIKSEKVVALVGAMRPATALSADGNMNLFQAVTLAASPEAKGRGVMVVHNDSILPARYTTKQHANRIHTFIAGDHGCLGTFENGKPKFSYPASRPLGWKHFDIKSFDAKKGLPTVDILYGHLDVSVTMLSASLKAGAKGIVLAGMGSGCWTTQGGNNIEETMKAKGKFPLVTSYRTAFGFVGRDDDIYGLGHQAIGGGHLNPPKCRILLQLCLAMGMSLDSIKKTFG